MDIIGERKTHDAGVVDDHKNDGESTEKIEAGLTSAIDETRIDGRCSHGIGKVN